jgi:hypothetical protein
MIGLADASKHLPDPYQGLFMQRVRLDQPVLASLHTTTQLSSKQCQHITVET